MGMRLEALMIDHEGRSSHAIVYKRDSSPTDFVVVEKPTMTRKEALDLTG